MFTTISETRRKLLLINAMFEADQIAVRFAQRLSESQVIVVWHNEVEGFHSFGFNFQPKDSVILGKDLINSFSGSALYGSICQPVAINTKGKWECMDSEMTAIFK